MPPLRGTAHDRLVHIHVSCMGTGVLLLTVFPPMRCYRHPVRYHGVSHSHSTSDFGKARRDFKRVRRRAKNSVRVKTTKYGPESSLSSFKSDVVSVLPRKDIYRHPGSFTDNECVNNYTPVCPKPVCYLTTVPWSSRMASCMLHYGCRGIFGRRNAGTICDYIENNAKAPLAFADAFLRHLGIVTGGVPGRVRQECISGYWQRVSWNLGRG